MTGNNPKIYLIGSLRNEAIPAIGSCLRDLGYEVFDDWFAAGPEADDYWKQYETARGHGYAEALRGHAAEHVFHFDQGHLDSSDLGVLVLPAGRSGHLELGYIIGQGKPGFILHDNPERWDVMYRFATGVFFTDEELYNELASFIQAPADLQVHNHQQYVRSDSGIPQLVGPYVAHLHE
jgi:hypothetical protein